MPKAGDRLVIQISMGHNQVRWEAFVGNGETMIL
jgi:hypothetical protein